MRLTLKPEWCEPGFWPSTLTDSPFVELEAEPCFKPVLDAEVDKPETADDLDIFARDLLGAVLNELAQIPSDRPLHVLVSGGYDSRILATLIVEEIRAGGLETVTFITDGEEEPEATDTLDYLEVPSNLRYRHNLDQDDPYALVDKTVEGWAPIYHQMRFFPNWRHENTVLITGLGGGEWFDYPAAGWHAPRTPRITHDSLRNMWIDTWPQYWLLPEAWARGYSAMVNPYATPRYAAVANGCKREWLTEIRGYPALDRVRAAMLDYLDPELKGLGWKPHVYDWRLSRAARDEIDDRYRRSWLYKTFHRPQWGMPSAMHGAEHACLMGGFAQWCEKLTVDGHEIRVQS